jgi:hypothetical protein
LKRQPHLGIMGFPSTLGEVKPDRHLVSARSDDLIEEHHDATAKPGDAAASPRETVGWVLCFCEQMSRSPTRQPARGQASPNAKAHGCHIGLVGPIDHRTVVRLAAAHQ